MPAPKPATIAGQLLEEISAHLLHGGHMLPEDSPQWTRLWDLCEKLQVADVVAASAHKADLFHLSGNVERALYWANNARRNGGQRAGDSALFTAYVNLGYAEEAAKIFPTLLDIEDGLINAWLISGFGCGSFSEMVTASERLERAGGEITRKGVVRLATRARAALELLGVSEHQLRVMMDHAGQLMRARHLLWLNEAPDVLASRPGESQYVALNYRLDVPPVQAAEMTWELAERLAEHDLVRPNVTVGFIGEKNEAASHQA